jgi:hypothetical protein
VHRPDTHTSQPSTYSQMPPPPIHRSTHPHSNVTVPAPAPPYEYAPSPPARQMSESSSYHSSISDTGPSTPAGYPFTAAGTNASGSRSQPQRYTMPVPIHPNITASAPYDSGSYNSGPYHSGPHHSGSSRPNIVDSPPQSVMSGGSPPNSTQDWSYRGCSTLVTYSNQLNNA